MQNIIKVLIINALALVSIVGCRAQDKSAITSKELRDHVYYLASPGLGGRYPGTSGDSLAALYIRNSFRDYGLTLMGEEGYQSFPVITGVSMGEGNELRLGGVDAVVKKDFTPLSISENGKFSAPVVFLGYGFRLKTDSLQWDDYQGIDVRGKAAIILLGAPEPPKGSGTDPFESAGSIRTKLLAARDAGVAAVILVAGPSYDEKDELDFTTIKENSAGLAVVRVRRSFLDPLLQPSGVTVASLESQLAREGKPVQTSVGFDCQIKTDILTQKATTRNVMAMVPAGAAGDTREWVVVGAHFDHLGLGGPGSNSRVPDTVAVHGGADDNASGVAGIIEIAGYLASVRENLKRPVLFVAFTGEEMGLLGSKYFLANSPVPADRITAMLNLDMIGRPNAEKRLAISGTGTAAEMESVLAATDPGNLSWAKSPEGFGPSDHASFYTGNIPVLYFSTGGHMDYHTPHDTPDKLDYSNMEEICKQVASLAVTIAKEPVRLTFREAGPKSSDSGRKKLKVTLGIKPDESGMENNGLGVDFVIPGKPAQLAGIQKGDRITAINGQPVTNVYDYMTRLQTLKAGQTASVELFRDDRKMLVLVQL